jgi:VCBS repeat-containing protein
VLDNIKLVKVPDNIGVEDNWVNLNKINAQLHDNDGSEKLQVTLNDIPVGATIKSGTNTFTSTLGNSSVDISKWDLTTLQVKPPQDFNGKFDLNVTAIATETVGGSSASNTIKIPVTVIAAPDAAVIGGVDTGRVQEDSHFVNGQITSGGQLTIKDVDGVNEQAFKAITASDPASKGIYGSLLMDSSGKWTYTLANSSSIVQDLNTADSKQETFTVQSVDGTTKTITVDVQGLDDPLKIEVGRPGTADDQVIEGNALVFNVTLGGTTTDKTSYAISLAGTATGGTGPDSDYANATYSNGVTYNAATKSLDVPAGVSSFSITVRTIDDMKVEPTETVELTLGGVKVTGTILDNDGATGGNTIQGRSGVDFFTLNSDGTLTSSLNGYNYFDPGHEGDNAYYHSVAGVLTNPNVGLKNDLIVSAGDSNDYVDLGLSSGNNTVYTGTSLPNQNNTNVSQEQVLKFDFMSQDVLTTPNGIMIGDIQTKTQPYADTVNLGSGDDKVFSSGGNAMMHGGLGNDELHGGKGIDGLRGGAGDDILTGGAGSDVLRGDSDADTFKWVLGDESIKMGAIDSGANNIYGIQSTIKVVANATDIVMDFKAAEHDVLDLRDILQGEKHDASNPNDIGNLLNFLHVEKSNGNTVLHVSTGGEFTNGSYNAGNENQTIILHGVDLTGANDTDIIKNLLNNQNLRVD